MAIYLEFITVVVRKDAIDQRFPHGLAGFEKLFRKKTYTSDEHLAGVGFMGPPDVKRFVETLESMGLTFLEDGECRDLAVVDRWVGPTAPCPWLEEGAWEDAGRICWLAGTEPGEVSIPPALIDAGWFGDPAQGDRPTPPGAGPGVGGQT